MKWMLLKEKNNMYYQDNEKTKHFISSYCVKEDILPFGILSVIFMYSWLLLSGHLIVSGTQSKINRKRNRKIQKHRLAHFNLWAVLPKNQHQKRSTKSDPSSVFHRPEMDTEWTYIREPIETNSMVLKGLLPETEYQFVVRAVNAHGASPPSHINNPVRTLGKAPPLTSMLPVCDETARPSLADRISKQSPLLFGFNDSHAWNYTSSACFLHRQG